MYVCLGTTPVNSVSHKTTIHSCKSRNTLNLIDKSQRISKGKKSALLTNTVTRALPFFPTKA